MNRKDKIVPWMPFPVIRGPILAAFFYGLLIFCGILSFGILVSCGTLAAATGIAAKAAGDAGYISPSLAYALVQSSEAVNKAVEEITPEQEYYIGRAVGANILARYKIYTQSPAMTEYLNMIANTLAINSLRPALYNGYHVAILDSLEINAFATSGGHIFITRGLLNCANSEDSLASVIAHEIAHIQLQHSIKAIKTSRITKALFVTGSSMVGAVTEGTSLEELTDIFDESVEEIVATMVNNGYSQTQEFNADEIALSLLAAAGYEPSALIDMLRVLEKNQANHPGGFNTTHPSPEVRIRNANNRLREYRVPDTRSYRRARYRAVK
ncbi:MAG: M48 family metalloprotease [Spirochaetaceae bacterium]|jgi:predicted Zn-dependent protease|nr:M48 family metalloprotease [Spirochaetaceae bacterium]